MRPFRNSSVAKIDRDLTMAGHRFAGFHSQVNYGDVDSDPDLTRAQNERKLALRHGIKRDNPDVTGVEFDPDGAARIHFKTPEAAQAYAAEHGFYNPNVPGLQRYERGSTEVYIPASEVRQFGNDELGGSNGTILANRFARRPGVDEIQVNEGTADNPNVTFTCFNKDRNKDDKTAQDYAAWLKKQGVNSEVSGNQVTVSREALASLPPGTVDGPSGNHQNRYTQSGMTQGPT
jgi:hypothetical protein